MRKEQWQPMRCHKVRHCARPVLRAVGEPLGGPVPSSAVSTVTAVVCESCGSSCAGTGQRRFPAPYKAFNLKRGNKRRGPKCCRAAAAKAPGAVLNERLQLQQEENGITESRHEQNGPIRGASIRSQSADRSVTAQVGLRSQVWRG